MQLMLFSLFLLLMDHGRDVSRSTCSLLIFARAALARYILYGQWLEDHVIFEALDNHLSLFMEISGNIKG